MLFPSFPRALGRFLSRAIMKKDMRPKGICYHTMLSKFNLSRILKYDCRGIRSIGLSENNVLR